jgi:hypothetical protein
VEAAVIKRNVSADPATHIVCCVHELAVTRDAPRSIVLSSCPVEMRFSVLACVSPTFLRLSAPTLDVQISIDGTISGYDQGGIMEQIATQMYTENFRKRAVQRTLDAYQIKEPDDGFLQFTLLLLTQSDDYVLFLLLYQPEGSLHFERITGAVFEKKVRELNVKLVFPDALKSWTRREVRIG